MRIPFYIPCSMAFVLMGICAGDAQADTVVNERFCSLQVYYWQRSNSSFAETTQSAPKKQAPLFLEPLNLWYRKGEGFTRVQVGAGQRSDTFTIPVADDEIIFYRENPETHKKLSADMMRRVAVPAQMRQGLLIAYAFDHMELFDVSEAHIPKNALRFINRSKRVVAFKTEGVVNVLQAGESGLVAIAPGRVPFMLGTQDSTGQWHLFYANKLAIPKQARMLAIIYPESKDTTALTVQWMMIP